MHPWMVNNCYRLYHFFRLLLTSLYLISRTRQNGLFCLVGSVIKTQSGLYLDDKYVWLVTGLIHDTCYIFGYIMAAFVKKKSYDEMGKKTSKNCHLINRDCYFHVSEMMGLFHCWCQVVSEVIKCTFLVKFFYAMRLKKALLINVHNENDVCNTWHFICQYHDTFMSVMCSRRHSDQIRCEGLIWHEHPTDSMFTTQQYVILCIRPWSSVFFSYATCRAFSWFGNFLIWQYNLFNNYFAYTII